MAKLQEIAKLVRPRRAPDAGGDTLSNQVRPVFTPITEVRLRVPPVTALRWSIKIAAPDGRRYWWGDFHFAEGLAKALRRLGQDVTVDAHEAWYGNINDADVVLVLRGRQAYDPDPHHINLLWVISHPDAVTPEEWLRYDHAFVASPRVASVAPPRGQTPVESLLQATAAGRFKPGPPESDLRHEVLFVGNTRWRLRPVVEDALANDLPLSVYGDGWDGRLPDGVLREARIPNHQLPRYYRSAGVLLNDHWEDMRRAQILSNRLFDATACGARVVSDAVEGLDSVFGDAVSTYEEPQQVGSIVRHLLADPENGRASRLELAEHVRKHHSFMKRARRLLNVAHNLAAARVGRLYDDSSFAGDDA